jgi:hypothetical protein
MHSDGHEMSMPHRTRRVVCSAPHRERLQARTGIGAGLVAVRRWGQDAGAVMPEACSTTAQSAAHVPHLTADRRATP